MFIHEHLVHPDYEWRVILCHRCLQIQNNKCFESFEDVLSDENDTSGTQTIVMAFIGREEKKERDHHYSSRMACKSHVIHVPGLIYASELFGVINIKDTNMIYIFSYNQFGLCDKKYISTMQGSFCECTQPMRHDVTL